MHLYLPKRCRHILEVFKRFLFFRYSLPMSVNNGYEIASLCAIFMINTALIFEWPIMRNHLMGSIILFDFECRSHFLNRYCYTYE